jgi:hypothetical protein
MKMAFGDQELCSTLKKGLPKRRPDVMLPEGVREGLAACGGKSGRDKEKGYLSDQLVRK